MTTEHKELRRSDPSGGVPERSYPAQRLRVVEAGPVFFLEVQAGTRTFRTGVFECLPAREVQLAAIRSRLSAWLLSKTGDRLEDLENFLGNLTPATIEALVIEHDAGGLTVLDTSRCYELYTEWRECNGTALSVD